MTTGEMIKSGDEIFLNSVSYLIPWRGSTCSANLPLTGKTILSPSFSADLCEKFELIIPC